MDKAKIIKTIGVAAILGIITGITYYFVTHRSLFVFFLPL